MNIGFFPIGQMDPLDHTGDPGSKGQYGVLKIQTSPLGTDISAGGSAGDGTNGKSCDTFYASRGALASSATDF